MDLESYKSQNFCTEVYIAILSRPLMNFMYIWPDGRCRSRGLLSMIPPSDLEFSYKSQNVCILVYIAIPSRPSDEFHLYLT